MSQLCQLQALVSDEYEVTLSVAENDSIDGTAEWLNNTVLDSTHPFKETVVSTKKLGTQQYGSVWNIDRLKNLAAARQQCLDQVRVSDFDKIAYIEVDCQWDPNWAKELILARHPAQVGIEPDIYSGWSLRTLSHPKQSMFLYDTCATRQLPTHTCWDFERAARVEGGWVNDSLIRTYFTDIDSNCLHRVWSTFSCFCVYRAKPFSDGLKWGYVNHRINPSNLWVEDGDYGSGWADADTSIMCESFRNAGYSNILLNTNVLIRHS